MTKRNRHLSIAAAITVACLMLAAGWWVRHFRRYTPAEVLADVRAGLGARDAAHPVEQFLELRYGPLTEPANRQRAFLDFFNLGHIRGLQFISRHQSAEQQRTNSAAMAQWIGQFRTNLTAEDRQALRAALGPDGGREVVQAATAQYMAQDAHYRAAAAPVITELLTTLTELKRQNPPP